MILGLGLEMEEALSKDIIFIRKYVLSSWERCINSGAVAGGYATLIEFQIRNWMISSITIKVLSILHKYLLKK